MALTVTKVHNAPLVAPYVHRFGCAREAEIDVNKQIDLYMSSFHFKNLV